MLLPKSCEDIFVKFAHSMVFMQDLLMKGTGRSASIPDLHHFRGSFGAKEILPLYRNASCTEPNILPGLLDILSKEFGCAVTSEDFAGYVYAVLAQPEYTRRFADELASREVRVPLTKAKKLFRKVSDFGKELIWLHTYGERLHDAEHPAGQIPCTQ